MMIRAALRDMQARRRRFAIAIIGAGLVLALASVMTGLTDSFTKEGHRTISLMGGDSWVVASGDGGPFTATTLLDEATVDAVRRSVGVIEAEPVLVSREMVRSTGAPVFSILVGVEPGRLGAPKSPRGLPLNRPGDVVVDDGLKASLGGTIIIADHPFVVTGIVRSSLFAGTPAVYMAIDEARNLSIGGAALSSAVLVRGTPEVLRAGLQRLTPNAVVLDALEPVKAASGTIGLVRTLLWLVAALIVGSVLYLNALERTRDMAIFKAVGVSTRSIAGGLAVQALVVAGAAAALAALIATLIAPLFPLSVELTSKGYVAIAVVAVIVSLLGATSGLRRAVRTSPVLAFGAQ
jgi:putative ABC transport system permease protein